MQLWWQISLELMERDGVDFDVLKKGKDFIIKLKRKSKINKSYYLKKYKRFKILFEDNKIIIPEVEYKEGKTKIVILSSI